MQLEVKVLFTKFSQVRLSHISKPAQYGFVRTKDYHIQEVWLPPKLKDDRSLNRWAKVRIKYPVDNLAPEWDQAKSLIAKCWSHFDLVVAQLNSHRWCHKEYDNY